MTRLLLLLLFLLPSMTLSSLNLIPILESGQRYCIIDDLPFSFVLDGLRQYYELNPDIKRPLDESSIFYMIKFLLYSVAPIDRITITRHEDVDGDGDIDPCFFIGNESSFDYVPLALPRTTQDILEFVYVLGFKTPLEWFTASQNESAQSEYCDGIPPNTRSVRSKIVKWVWCALRTSYQKLKISDERRSVKFTNSTASPLPWSNGLDDGSINVIRDEMITTIKDARGFVSGFDEKYPTLSKKLVNLKTSSSKLFGSLPFMIESPNKILARFKSSKKSLLIKLEGLKNIRNGPYLQRAYNHHLDHRLRYDLWNASEPSSLFMSALDESNTLDNEPHSFYVTGVRTYEGMAPGQYHVWNLEHWPSNGKVAKDFLNWGTQGAIGDWSCDLALCEPCAPFISDSIHGCTWPDPSLHMLNFIERWFPGLDTENPGCEAYSTDLAYLWGLGVFLFGASIPPNLLFCLIWNSYIIGLWLVIGAYIIVLGAIITAIFYCCWRIQDSCTNGDVDHEQNLRRMIRQKDRTREVEKINSAQAMQIDDSRREINQVKEQIRILQKGMMQSSNDDDDDIVNAVFDSKDSQSDAWVKDFVKHRGESNKTWIS